MQYFRSMKRNDTGPPVKAHLVSKASGSDVDLTSVTITFVMYSINDDGTKTELVNAAATPSATPTDGTFEYDWQTGDTSVIGTHQAAFQLIFTAESNRKETYPASGWINIEIQPDLEDA